MPSDRFVLAASHLGQTVDLWKLVRSPDQFLVWNCEFPTYHHTYRDGEHPHSTAQDGLESAPVHPAIVAALQARETGRKAKHQPMGWPTRWSDVEDYQATIGIGFIYPDDLPRFDPRPAGRRWRRLVVPLADGQGVQATHYLAWPTEVTRRYVDAMRALPGTVEVRMLDQWEPWSIVHVQVTEPGAVQVRRANQ